MIKAAGVELFSVVSNIRAMPDLRRKDIRAWPPWPLYFFIFSEDVPVLIHQSPAKPYPASIYKNEL
jgi:hypothetical protein